MKNYVPASSAFHRMVLIKKLPPRLVCEGNVCVCYSGAPKIYELAEIIYFRLSTTERKTTAFSRFADVTSSIGIRQAHNDDVLAPVGEAKVEKDISQRHG